MKSVRDLFSIAILREAAAKDLTIDTILSQNPIVPVVTIVDAEDAIPLASALMEGGIRIIEVALRSDAALQAIQRIARAAPEMIVGAGTLKREEDFAAAVDAGAHFVVSPGTTLGLLEAASRYNLPFLPGAATPSEIMRLVHAGYRVQKFFPAATLGGIDGVKSLAGPFPEVSFCPSGGVNVDNFADYLALDNVTSISGTWLTPRDAVAKGQWQTITRLARDAVAALQ